ncbi:MAG: hypothetical protein M1537_07975 [Nitrospirae bacterium]|jgi:hypothetical protein|nr:hypothetical protein [Nitrospirota bacterium]MCL5284899.1 hypothetical protein [Nitrospirota bacterium]
MAWSHIHPALIHFVVGLGIIVFLWDLVRLSHPPGAREDDGPFGLALEGVLGIVLLGVATGWIALAHDTVLQNGGREIFLGSLHGKMGVFFLGLSTARVLGGPAPRSLRLRKFWAGIDIGLILLLLGTALLGERLVFHLGLGLSGLTL